MSNRDPFEETKKELEEMAQQMIKDYLLPLQTKKLSKKMIEQIAAECAAQIASAAAVVGRKASSRYAAQLTSPFSEILNNQQPSSPIFNDKLASLVGKLSPEDIEKLKNDHEIAARVVSRVYKSIFDFALEIGLKTFEGQSNDQSKE